MPYRGYADSSLKSTYKAIVLPPKKVKNNTNIKLRIICALSLLIVITIVVFESIIYIQNYKETDLYEYLSDDGIYKLEIVELGQISEKYGPTNCEFKLYSNNELFDKYKFIVLNDGELPAEDDFEVEWLDDKVKIKVSGEDQKDKLYYLKLKNMKEDTD